jgi:hypothetical protein
MPANSDPADAMRELRRRMLTDSPAAFGLAPSSAFPKVYGVVMDWPVSGGAIVSVVALADGNASLYTTGTFGIIGGYGHEGVRTAAINLVQGAAAHDEGASTVLDCGYPAADRIFFYLTTYAGLRRIEGNLDSVASGRDVLSPVFGLGQNLISALRKVTEAGSRN